MKIKQFILATSALLTTLLITSCTDNKMTKTFGGTTTVELSQGERLINITWKESNLWVLTKQDTTKPTNWTFKEVSNFGIFEGKIIIKEK